MALKNVKYVLINENNESIKNKDGSFEIKTAEIILENTAEIEEFNASNLIALQKLRSYKNYK